MSDDRPDRDETPVERADRNMAELLQELRVALPGVQVLFAFLLAVPFQARFANVTQFQETTYFVTLLLSAIASALLIAPTAYHRLNFARRDKPHIVEVANKMSIVGLAALSLAMTGAIMLVTDFLYDGKAVSITVGAIALAFFALWFVLPLLRRMRRKVDEATDADSSPPRASVPAAGR